jgi:cobaltochelatase CobS
MMNATNETNGGMAMLANSKVTCEVCGASAHFLELHLAQEHEMSVEAYQESHPDAPVLSKAAEAKLRELEVQARNEMVDLNIKDLFGIEINERIKTVKGWAQPHETTPDVDPDYEFRRELLAVVLYVLETEDEICLLTGPTGSGKTSVYEQVIARLNMPCYKVNFDADITRADFVGTWVLAGKDDMKFNYGVLPKAMREGAPLILDEWDCINPSVGMVLQPVLEGKPLTITETAEVIKPAKGFKILGTSNTLGQGDSTGLYNGTQPQNFAQLDRYATVEVVDYPTKPQEKRILVKKTGIKDPDILDKMLEFGRLVRSAFMKEEIMCTVSTRTMVNIAKKLKAFGDIKRAYELAFINKLSGDDKSFCYEILQRVWGV